MINVTGEDSGYDQTGNWEELDCSVNFPIKIMRDFVSSQLLGSLYKCDCGERMVEAGCGPGSMTKYLLQKKLTIVAVDRDPAMLDLARQAVSRSRRRSVEFLKDDVTRLSFPKNVWFKGEANVVIANAVLMHNSRAAVKRFFKNAYELLGKGGKVIVSISPHPDLLRVSTVEENSFIVYRLADDAQIKRKDIKSLLNGEIQCKESYMKPCGGETSGPNIWVHTGTFLRQAAREVGFRFIQEENIVITEDMLEATGFSPTLGVVGRSAYIIVTGIKK